MRLLSGNYRELCEAVLPAQRRQHSPPERYCGGRMMRERAGPRFFLEDFFFAAFFLPALRFFIAMNRAPSG
jgi:hypothetical protein